MKLKAQAIIVAAGKSRRFGSNTPKQFLPFYGKPLFIQSVLAFKKTRLFSKIVVVLPKEYTDKFKIFAKKYGFEIVQGGAERIDSVKAGLASLATGATRGLVAIHDGARPLIRPGIIKKALASARKHSAAIVAVAAKDTIKFSKDSTTIYKTLDRKYIWLAQTPQVFRFDLINKAYSMLRENNVTDDCQAAELIGIRPRLVPGDYFNIKITTKDDIEFAKQIFKRIESCL